MAYIYMITNDVNGKQYIGKTEFSIEKRFKKHLSDATRPQIEQRPLYKAINKYGPEHFHIEMIEETDNAEEREKFWIQYYGTFHNGYNATLGGDGRKLIDYDLVVKTYQEVQNCQQVADILQIHLDSVYKILEAKKCDRKPSQQINREKNSRPVAMMNLDGEILKVFYCANDAGRYLVDNQLTTGTFKGATSHIIHVCEGKRKTAYGFKWKRI